MVEMRKRGDVEEVERVWWTSVPRDVFLAGAGTMLSDVLGVLLSQLSAVVDIQDHGRY